MSTKGLAREKNDLDIVDNWDFNPIENVGSIVNVGRFAQWKYYWTDDCVLRAKNVAIEYWKANDMERVLITGCLGFVGVNLAVHFLKQGIKVYGIDNRSKVVGSHQNHELFTSNSGQFHYCDIRNNEEVKGVIESFSPVDCIFHLASQVSFKRSVESPRNDFEINLFGTLNLLEFIRLKRRVPSLFMLLRTKYMAD